MDYVTNVPFKKYIGWTFYENHLALKVSDADCAEDAIRDVIQEFADYENCLAADDEYIMLSGTTSLGRFRTREFTNFDAEISYDYSTGKGSYVVYADVVVNVYAIWVYDDCHGLDESNDLEDFDCYEEELYDVDFKGKYYKYFPHTRPEKNYRLSPKYERLIEYVHEQDRNTGIWVA